MRQPRCYGATCAPHGLPEAIRPRYTAQMERLSPLLVTSLPLALCTLSGCAACEAPAAAVPSLVFESGDTVLRVEEDPFALVIEGGGRTLRSDGDCGGIAVALRADDDDGTRYSRPDAPAAGLTWLHAIRVEEREDDAFTLALESGQGETAKATMRVAPGLEGFVDVQLDVDRPEESVALTSVCFALTSGEHVVGGGERFGGVDLSGRTIPLSFNAPGRYDSGTNESHAPVPFFASNRGYAALFETERPGAFDVGETAPDRLVARFQGPSLRVRLRSGDIVDNVAAHARLMGLPPPPPRYALAPHLWRNENAVTVADGVVTYSGQDRLLEDARTLRELDIPTTTLWVDAPWSTGYNTFEWNRVQFPDPQGMLEELERLGFRVIVWATEHINDTDDSAQMFGMPPYGSLELFDEYRTQGWLVGDATTQEPFRFPWGRGNGGYVDFTHPEAVRDFQERLRPLVRAGIRGFKLDYGETMRPDILGAAHNRNITFHDGSTSDVMHTRYARLYHQAFLEVLEEEHPGDWFVITRTGGIYDQRNGVTLWPGDLDNDLSRPGDVLSGGGFAVGGLPAAVSGALSSSMSGYPLYGSDIGGYRGGPPSRLSLLRWAAFGAVSTIMQLGGGGTGDETHNPWDPRYGDGAADIYRRFARLHMDLVPTLEVLLHDASVTGRPPLVPVGVHMVDDEEAWADEETFLLGRDLLAAPVVDDSDARTLRFPAGTWVSYWDPEEFTGPITATVLASLADLPLFQRQGSVLLLGHPLLETLVESDADGVFAAEQSGLVARTTAGPAGDAVSLDGVVATQRTLDDVTAVALRAPGERWLAVQLRLVTGGPGADALVVVNGNEAAEAPSQLAALQCDAPCVFRGEDELFVVGKARELIVEFSSP